MYNQTNNLLCNNTFSFHIKPVIISIDFQESLHSHIIRLVRAFRTITERRTEEGPWDSDSFKVLLICLSTSKLFKIFLPFYQFDRFQKIVFIEGQISEMFFLFIVLFQLLILKLVFFNEKFFIFKYFFYRMISYFCIIKL